MGENLKFCWTPRAIVQSGENTQSRWVVHRAMRILFVHERFGSLGGAEANALITARELKAKGHEVALAHGAPTGKGEDRWKTVFESCYPLQPDRNAASVIESALNDFQPDVLYVHKMADLTVIEALAKTGLPMVRMVHDHDIYCMRSYKYFYSSREICTRAASAYCVFGCGAFLARNRGDGFPFKYVSYVKKRREIALNKRFDRMIVVSNYMRGELLKNGFDPGRIEIHPPVPPPGDPNLRSSFSNRNLIIYAGQIIRGKGVDVLLESLALLKTNFECIILGEGGHRAHCEELAGRLGLKDKVTFKGFIPQEELKEYYRECSVVAVSSVWPEPIATIGMEVMRYALPVVGFDAGGVSDWLINGVNGFLVPWMDKRAFAGSLERLLSDKALAREMGSRGLEIVSEKFDFAAYIDGLENFFERVIQEKKENHAARPALMAA
jgi:glycosyltransferase involved in cell wall biosynthesis